MGPRRTGVYHSFAPNKRYNIIDEAVVAVASGCPLLTTLKLHGCNKITDAAVVAVASGCPQLTTLNLHGCRKITDAAVVAVASGRKLLTGRFPLGFP